MRKSNLTTLCYLEKDGCYLMMHRVRKQQDVNAGKWIGVGGHFEPGRVRKNVCCGKSGRRPG